MKKLKLFFACLLMAVLSIGQVWATEETKTEGFETKTASTSYNSTVTVTTAESDCGIGWTIYYGTVSTNDKISGSNSAQMRYYSSSDSRGYVQSTTPVDGLSNVAFKARVSSTNIQMTVSYSADASTWTALATNETFSETGKGIAFNYDVPSGGKYIKIEIGDGSTKPSSGNIKFIIDDVVFTYETGSSTPTCATPTFLPAAGSYEGTQNVTISSTEGATIYYTTDGSDPSASSSVYSSPIAVSASQTIKAYAVKADYEDSEVAEAAYVITEGPDVTLDLVDGNWGFPTSNTTGTETYTNSVTGYSVTCYAPTNYKVSGSSYFYLGKSGAYIELPSFSSPIEKIVVTGNSGASTGVIWNIFKGDDAVSTAATGCAESSYTFNIDPEEANVTYTLKVTSAHNLQIKAIKIFFGEAPAVATPTISGATPFATTTTVTLGCTTDGALIYYTTDGTDPTSSSSLYENPFELNASATVKAIAILSSDQSSIASKEFEKVTSYTTLADIFTKAEEVSSTATDIYVTFDGWKVSAKTNNNAFLTDGTNGAVIYGNGHGFNAGDVLTGTAACKVQLYKGFAELTALTSGTTGLTVTPGSVGDPVVKTWEQLSAVNTGALVKLENLTYDGSSLSDGVNTIPTYTTFYTATFEAGKSYNLTGVYQYYDTDGQILPRSVDDVEEIVDPGKVATPTFSPEGGEFSEAQNVTITCATEDATIYYTIDGTDPSTTSTVYSSAIEVSETTTIKAFAVKAEMTNSDIASATYTITGPQVTFNYVDYKGEGTSSSGSEYTMVKTDIVSIGDTKFYGNNNYAHFYAGGVTTITPASGVTITQIVLTASETNYNGYQSSGTVTASAGSLSHEGKVVTWTGSADAAFTITHDKQIRWLTIVVTYEEADPSAPTLAVVPNVIDFGEVEQGSTVDAQTVAVNFANLTGEVTYSGLSSPFSATGTISATGDLISISADATVEVGEYEQTLTVTSAADSKSATVTVKMNIVAAETGEQFVKVTETPAESDWSGDYLLVYESGTTAYVWDGTDAAESSKTATIKSGNKIIKPEGAAVVSIEAVTGGHSLQISGGTNDGKYIVDNGNNAGLKFGDAAYAATITYETDWTKILFSQRCIRYNSSSGQERFRYYADNNQQAVQLYKAVNSKAPAGLAYETASVEKLEGAAKFTNEITNDNSLTVAYSSNNTDVATVDAASGEVTIVAAGVAEITASTLGDETHKAGSAKYTVCVTAHAGTEADPYTVADAKIVIDALGTKESVYASGIICQVDAIDLTENFYATYWISADGLTDGQKLEAFHGKYLNNADFSAEDDIKVGDEVVIVGNLKKFGTSIYEFDGGNYLTSLSRTKVAAGLAYETASVEKNVGDEAFTNTLTNPYEVTVAYSSSAPSVASVNAETGLVTVNAMGEATITATFGGNGSYLPGSASYTISVSDPSITKVTFDATIDMTASSEVLTLTKNGVTMEISKGQMHNGVSYRLNKDQTLTLSCEDGLISRIELEGTDPSYAVTNITAAGYSNGVWTGSAESVDLVASVAQARMTKINVYYGADSREVAGLAYVVAAIEKNVGDANFTNALTNPNSVTVAYSSSDASVASVDAETGEVTIVAAGEAIITASFAGNTTYKSANVSYTITVSPAVVPPTPSTGTTYRKVTATEDITDGEYLIVYEGDNTHDAYAFNGSLENIDQAKVGVAVTINEGVIAGTTAIDAAVFTIDLTAGTLQSASGWYIGRETNSNGMDKSETTQYVNTFAITDGKAVITGASGCTLRYNYAADQLRFRYYTSGQRDIQLYKKETPEPPTPVYETVRDGLTAGNYYTVCYNKTMNEIRGASLWQFLNKDASYAYIVEAEAPYAAGKPYIIYAESDKLEAVLEGDPVEASAIVANGALHGTFEKLYQGDLDDAGDDIYLVIGNQLRRATGLGQTGNTLPAYRAYVVLSEIPNAGVPAPGKKVRKMPMQGQTTTDCELTNAAEAPAKMMINGQLYILRGEKKYDATGRLVK